MNPDVLAYGFIQYVVFLFSTTCHEASHALVSKWGGDSTAAEQVSLNPLPHIRREPFGMVVVPLLGVFMGGGLIGWASAPYDPYWSQRHPKRAAWMSLAGPAANFSLAVLAAILMRIGMLAGVFAATFNPVHMVMAPGGGFAEGLAMVLDVFFSLNILLGCFNLIPFPPLDGYGVLGLFVSEDGARRLQALRGQMGMFAIVGLLIAWRVIGAVYTPVLLIAAQLALLGVSYHPLAS